MTHQIFSEELFSPPPESVVPPVKELTADQQIKLKTLEEHFGRQDYQLPIKLHDEEKSALSEREMIFLSRETFVRYVQTDGRESQAGISILIAVCSATRYSFLIATKGDLHATTTRLEECLIWRRTERIDDIEYMAADCEEEAKTGKNIVMGFSNQSQPVLYFFPNRNITPVEQRRAVHAVFMLERAKDLCVAGVTNVVVIFNFAGKRQGPPTSISVARQTLHILSNYYPETLGRSVFQNMPWIVKTFVNLMWPFVFANTKKKVTFGSVEGQEVIKEGYVSPNQLLIEGGGELDIPYDHDTYWPALIKTCKRLRGEEEERWRALGESRVGREERLFKRQPPSSEAVNE